MRERPITLPAGSIQRIRAGLATVDVIPVNPITGTDIEGHTPATFETFDPNNINTARFWGALQTHTHIFERDQHDFPTKATHITKNEHRITTHEITWHINYRQ